MAYDNKTRTISLGRQNDSTFLLDSGVAYIYELRQDSEYPSVSPQVKIDWKTIENWLGCSGRELNSNDIEKIKGAWGAYIAVGVAPSSSLQPVFDKLLNQEDVKVFIKDKPPTSVMDVFDRLLASDEEILAKRAIDHKGLKNTVDEMANILKSARNSKQSPTPKIPDQTTEIKLKINSLTKRKRIFIATTLTWVIWVALRSSGDYEILGNQLNQWDVDMFFANLLLPPITIFSSFKIYSWISSAEK